jgi:quercetin dioxygenase-like cupin family protein
MAKKEMAAAYVTDKNRVFVRPIQGEYNLKEELKRLRSLPRVRSTVEVEYNAGPQVFGKHYLEPRDGLGQTLHIHLQEYAPGAKSQKHGHVNEAVFYILDGEGAEEHDGVRYEWEAGDVAIVHNNCVHQHFNRSTTKPARTLILKTKPMYLFMNMLFQRSINKHQEVPSPYAPNYEPREEPADGFYHDLYSEDAHDHDHDHDHAHDHDHEHAHVH